MNFQSIFDQLFARLQTDILFDVVLAALVATLVYLLILSRRVSNLTQGASGASLESTIQSLVARTTALESRAGQTDQSIAQHHARLQTAVRGVSVRRFDPFQNQGGQQSFSSALVDERGHGVVLSGIHARDGVRVYAKDVQNFVSERELSEDESNAIQDAKKKL